MKRLSILFALMMTALAARADDNAFAPKFSGYLFGDYYYMVGADGAAKRGNAQYSATPKDYQGFQFRRMYFIYDQPFSDKFASQLILEGTDASLDPGGRFGIYMKTAFIEWKEIIPRANFRMGLIPTVIWTQSERFWNYRCIEKTIADQRGLGQPVDLGVSLRGMIDAEGVVTYGVMIGNGMGFKPETNKFKKFSGEVTVHPVSHLYLQAYGDFEPNTGDANKSTIKGLAAYNAEDFTVGAEYVMQTAAKADSAAADITPNGLSLFAWAPIPGVDKLGAFARYDMFNPNSTISSFDASTKSSTSPYKESFLTVGLDYQPTPNVHFMPNVWINSYSAKGTAATRDADVVARVSFFYVHTVLSQRLKEQ